MKFKKRKENYNVYHYICEGCGAEGELKVPFGNHRINCPVDCGAVYIQWCDPFTYLPKLQCVVCPVFANEKDI